MGAGVVDAVGAVAAPGNGVLRTSVRAAGTALAGAAAGELIFGVVATGFRAMELLLCSLMKTLPAGANQQRPTQAMPSYQRSSQSNSSDQSSLRKSKKEE